jgi:outer membrane protein
MNKLLLILAFLSLNLKSEIIKDFVTKVQKKSPYIEELKYQFLSSDYSLKAKEGKFDTFFYSDFNYNDQRTKISTPLFDAGTTISAGIKKQTIFGLSFDLNHEYKKTTSPFLKFASNTGFSSSKTYAPTTSLSLSIPLLKNFLGYTNRKELKTIDVGLEKSREDFQKARDEIVLNILKKYFNVVLLKEQVYVSKVFLDSTKSLYSVMKRKIKIGGAEERTLLWAKSNYINAKKSYIDAKRTYHEALQDLNLMAGFNAEEYLKMDFSKTYIVKIYKKVKNKENKNKELKSIKLDIKSNNLNYDINENNMLPELNFSSGISFTGYDDKSISEAYKMWDTRMYFLGFSLVWDIANTSPKYLKKATEEYIKSLDSKYKLTEKSVENNIETIEHSIDKYLEELDLANESKKSLEKRFKLEWKAFYLGRASMRDVVEAQQGKATSGIEVLKVKNTLLDSILTLSLLKGSLLDCLY